MPELPEVETTLRGIEPLICGRQILELVLRTAKLRYPLEQGWCEQLAGQRVISVSRRAKYLLIGLSGGNLIIHLGMSGVLRVVPAEMTEQKHDHIDLIFADGNALRLSDPRRFGVFLYTEKPFAEHRLLAGLGPEPLGDEFSGSYLYRLSRGRSRAVKPFIMDQKIVVGVGNIYANEALFRAGIDPRRQAVKVSLRRYRLLVAKIKEVLSEAIAAGGTTIRDFRRSDGRPGYFAQELQVYGREGEPCCVCETSIRSLRLGQRSTCYCPRCQR
jgi:formamidopyrimidine-DNA glycosylase